MSEQPTPDPGAQSLPFPTRDLFLLMTPAFDIHWRVEPADFIDYVMAFDQQIEAHYRQSAVAGGFDTQVGVALLPGKGRLLDVQTDPPGVGVGHIEQLGRRIADIPVPEVIDGPVAFFRRGTFAGGAAEPTGFGLPFSDRVGGPGMHELDDVLMRAGGPHRPPPATPPPPPRSFWAALTGLFRGERRPARPTRPLRLMPEHEIVGTLSKLLLRPVIAPNGRMSIG